MKKRESYLRCLAESERAREWVARCDLVVVQGPMGRAERRVERGRVGEGFLWSERRVFFCDEMMMVEE